METSSSSASTAVGSGVQQLLETHAAARGRTGAALVLLHSRYGGGIEPTLREVRRALLTGRETLFEGSCRPDGATYRPIREIIARWTRVLEDLGELDTAVQRPLSEISASLGLPTAGAPSTPSTGGRGQLRFFETLGRVFCELSSRLPAVVVFHDVHMADSATLAALRFLFENVFSDPVGAFAPPGARQGGFVGTVVATLGETGEVFGALAAALADRDLCVLVSLRDIEEEQVRRFVTAPEVVDQLMLASGGSTENLRELFSVLPRRVEDLYGRRFERLARPERRVLDALAVLGRPVKPDFLLRVADTGDEAPSLSALADQRLIVRQVSRSEVLVEFPATDNRRFVYEAIPEDRRRMLHGRVAALLEERSRLGEPVDIETIAHHYLSSSIDDKAVSYAIEAAERLHISFAWQRARELLDEALPRVADAETRAQVLERLVELEGALLNHEGALGRADELLGAVAPSRQANVYRIRGEIRLQMGAWEEALKDADRADQAALDPRERLAVAAMRAESLYGRGDYDGALEVARTARSAASTTIAGDAARHVIQLTNTVGKVNLFLGRYDEALEDFCANQALAHREALPQEEVRALFNQGTIALQRRRYDEAERVFGTCLGYASETGNPVTRSFLELNLGVIYHKTLRYDLALRSYLTSLAMFRQSGNELQFAVTAMNLGSLYETVGDFARARRLLETAIEVCERRDIRYFNGRTQFVLGTLELLVGDFAAARRALERSGELLGRTGSTFAGRIRVALSRAAHGLGDRAWRDALINEPLEKGDAAELAEVAADAAIARGTFAFDQGDLAVALGEFTDALGRFERAEHHERIWLARGWVGLVLAERGEREPAMKALREALERIDQIAQTVPEPLREGYRMAPERRRIADALAALASGRRVGHSGVLPAVDQVTPAYRAWRARYGSIIGEDARLIQLLRVVDRIADSPSTVLIQGESGTGKELVAEAIHRHSSRQGGAFVKVNCAAFVETLLLSELFGHEKGAFTGALARKKGRFELADGGTLFLDEIGDISANTQVALLRVLQERSFERVGGGETVTTDVRLICATNRNLEEMVRAGTFRLDLYYRLKGVVVELPPLRERRADIPLIIDHFCRQLARDSGRPRRFSRDAMAWLVRYSWPGNIRELENFVRSMLLFVDEEHVELANVRQFDDFFADGNFIDRVPPEVVLSPDEAAATRPVLAPAAAGARPRLPDDASFAGQMAELALQSGLSLPELKDRLEIEMIRRALTSTGGNIARAARMLDMKRPRLSQIVNSTPELESLRGSLAGDGSDEAG